MDWRSLHLNPTEINPLCVSLEIQVFGFEGQIYCLEVRIRGGSMGGFAHADPSSGFVIWNALKSGFVALKTRSVALMTGSVALKTRSTCSKPLRGFAHWIRGSEAGSVALREWADLLP